jgi:hypothetical protein
MPALAAIFTALIAFFGRKVTVLLVIIPAFLLLTAGLMVSIKAGISSLLALAIIPPWISFSLGLFMPSNFSLILATVLGVQAAKWAYDIAVSKLVLIASSN